MPSITRSARLRSQAEFAASLAVQISDIAYQGRFKAAGIGRPRVNLVFANLADRAERLADLADRAEFGRDHLARRHAAEERLENLADSACGYGY